MQKKSLRALLVAAFVIGAVAVVPSVAGAATVSVTGPPNQLEYNAAANEVNEVSIVFTNGGRTAVVNDAAALLNTRRSALCGDRPASGHVHDRSGCVLQVNIELGDRDDTLTLDAGPVVVDSTSW